MPHTQNVYHYRLMNKICPRLARKDSRNTLPTCAGGGSRQGNVLGWVKIRKIKSVEYAPNTHSVAPLVIVAFNPDVSAVCVCGKTEIEGSQHRHDGAPDIVCRPGNDKSAFGAPSSQRTLAHRNVFGT